MAAASQPEPIQRRAAPSRDALTGLLTGAEFQECMRLTAELPQPEGCAALLVHFGLDRFRRLNRWLGFEAGDVALQTIADRLRGWMQEESVEGVSVGCRAGGDEFAALLTVRGGDSEAASSVRRLLEALQAPLSLSERAVFLTASVGYRVLGEGADTAAEWRAAAEAADRIRQRGGNASEMVRFCSSTDDESRHNLEVALRRAIENDELHLRFQPVVNRRCHIDGIEALLGWEHPDLGTVDTETFIQLAEQTGIIVPLGEWVLRRACRQILEWCRAGVAVPRMAVNVSPVQFAAPDFVDMVKRILDETGVPGGALQFEITENAVLRNMEESVERMRGLCELGITFAIDDFGVGYSPLTYLHRLPVDTVKVARAFTGEITRQGGSLALVHTITVLAHHRGLKVVAEGVETPGELEMVRAARCDRMQGFLFGSPVRALDIEPLLRQGGALGPSDCQTSGPSFF